MSDNGSGRIRGVWQTAVAPSATPIVVSMVGAPLPCTATLKSAAVGRLIELSTDGGVEYFTPTYYYSSATQLTVAVTTPVSHVRFTGAAADTWRIQ